MTIFQTECFLAVSAHLNFAKAAKQMNISQPAITRQIQTLETELGVKLFSRSTRAVRLTVEGQAFLTDARTMVAASKRALYRFAKQDKEEIVELHIGYSSVFHMEFWADALKTLTTHYPQLHPRLHTIPSSQLPAAVDSESLDIALSCRSPKGKSLPGSIFASQAKAPCCWSAPASALPSSLMSMYQSIRSWLPVRWTAISGFHLDCTISAAETALI